MVRTPGVRRSIASHCEGSRMFVVRMWFRGISALFKSSNDVTGSHARYLPQICVASGSNGRNSSATDGNAENIYYLEFKINHLSTIGVTSVSPPLMFLRGHGGGLKTSEDSSINFENPLKQKRWYKNTNNSDDNYFQKTVVVLGSGLEITGDYHSYSLHKRPGK